MLSRRIALFAVLLVGVVLVSGCTGQPGTQTAASCPGGLQSCGKGCVPTNAICCDANGANGYCLQPSPQCGQGTCYNCAAGKKFCGMFCIPEGQKCCIAGECEMNQTQPQSNQVSVTLVSAMDLACAFQKSELWFPEMPWDGSYICTGTVTLDFHGLTFSEGRTFRLTYDIPDGDEFGGFEDVRAQAGVPLNEVTFAYSRVGGDYFQKNQPPCPSTPALNKLKLIDLIPDVEKPFKAQYFDVNVKMSC